MSYKKEKPNFFVLDDYPTINLGGQEGKLIIGSSGKGKSIVGITLDKYQKEGWSSLTEPEKELINKFINKDA